MFPQHPSQPAEMFPQHPSQSAEILRRMLVEPSVKRPNGVDRAERVALNRQPVENVDGPFDEGSTTGHINVAGYARKNVIADAMLSITAAPAVHPGGFRRHGSMLGGPPALGTDSDGEVTHLEEDVNDEEDQGEILGLSIDHDSSGNDVLTY